MAKIFEYIDKDGNGSIDLSEVVENYKKEFNQPPNAQQIQNMTEHFAGLDSKAIEFSDFLVHAIDERILHSSERLATAFRYFDEDGGGTISPDEIVDGLNFNDADKMNQEIASAIMGQIQPELKELTFKNFILLINHYKTIPPNSQQVQSSPIPE